MLRVAAPNVVTMTSYTVMQFVDALMVSRITPASPVYVAAQGNGGIAVFLAISLVLGVQSVVTTFVAQHLGAGRAERGSAYAWSAIWIAGVSSVLMIPYALALPMIFGAIGHEGELLELETRYAQIMIAGAFFVTAARGVHHYFFGMHRAMIVMVAVILGGLVNVGINYVLIFGNFGMPAMGVAGAAVGTVAGAMCELALPLLVFLGGRFNREYATRSAWRPDRRAIADILRIGWPGGAMFVNELFCWTYLMVRLLPAAGEAAARSRGLGPEAIHEAGVVGNSAGWIALRYMHASFMPAVGLSIAVTAMVGRSMGMRRSDLARDRAWLGLRLAMGYMGLWSVAFVLFGAELMGVFVPGDMASEQAESLIRVGSAVMIAAAVFQLFDAIAITMSGALRGAGDTVWPGLATVVLSWTFIVGGGHLAIAIAPGLGALGPWIAASGFIITLGVSLLVRFRLGRWARIDLVSRDPEPASGPIGLALGSDRGPGETGEASGLVVRQGPGDGLAGVESARLEP